tara:strand:- start:240 stop:416 length:177 start_codon:yes stop_codon:yes gene_type:complete
MEKSDQLLLNKDNLVTAGSLQLHLRLLNTQIESRNCLPIPHTLTLVFSKPNGILWEKK